LNNTTEELTEGFTEVGELEPLRATKILETVNVNRPYLITVFVFIVIFLIKSLSALSLK